VLVGLASDGSGYFLGQGLWYLAAGWAYFFGRNMPRAQPQLEAVLTAIAALLLLTLIVHLLMRRFYNRPAAIGLPPRSWPVRKTLALVGVVVLVFGAGIAAVGVTHQTAWLATADEPRVKSSGRVGAHLRSQNNLKQMAIAAHNFLDEKKSLPSATT